MVYKIRVILDTKDDIFRDIEIKGKQTLWNLHEIIKTAFNLKGDELSVFNILGEEGEIIKTVPLEDMSEDGDGEIMSDIYIDEAFAEKEDKAQYQYGFIDLWEFFCELISIEDEKKAVKYPLTVFRFGNVPLKAPSKNKSKLSKNTTSSVPLLDDDLSLYNEFDVEDDFGSFEEDSFDADGFSEFDAFLEDEK